MGLSSLLPIWCCPTLLINKARVSWLGVREKHAESGQMRVGLFFLEHPEHNIYCSPLNTLRKVELQCAQVWRHVCIQCQTHGCAHVPAPAGTQKILNSDRIVVAGFLQKRSILGSQCNIFTSLAATPLSCPQAVCFWRDQRIQPVWAQGAIPLLFNTPANFTVVV